MAHRFGEVRDRAAGLLWSMRLPELAADGEEALWVWLPCDWHPESGHTAVYCNLNSNLDTLEEQLGYGRRHARLALPSKPIDSHTAERLFRFYGSVFLILDQCVEDLRDIWHAADGSNKRQTAKTKNGEKITKPVTQRANSIWKHRNGDGEHGRRMHRDHHHGPYVFADACDDITTARDAIGAEGGLMVPGLIDAFEMLADAMFYTDGLVADAATRAKIEVRFARAAVAV